MRHDEIKKIRLIQALSFAVAAGVASTCFSRGIWTGGAGAGNNFYERPANWTANHVPNANDQLLFVGPTSPTTSVVRWNQTTGNNQAANDLQVLSGDVTFMSDNVAGAPFAMTIYQNTILSGAATLRLSSIRLLTHGQAIKVDAGATFDVSTGAIATSQNFTIGVNGAGYGLVHNGGQLTAAVDGFVGAANGANGNLTIEGANSLVSANRALYTGFGTGVGHVTINSGGHLSVGNATAGNLSYSLLASDSSGDAAGGQIAAFAGSSIINNAGSAMVGLNSFGRVQSVGAGARWHNASDVYIGSGSGAIGQVIAAQGGTIDVDNDIVVASSLGRGTLSITEANSTVTAAHNVTLGGGPAGTIGQVVMDASGRLNIGDRAASAPLAASTVISDSSVNGSNGGTLSISGGANIFQTAGNLFVATGATDYGAVTIANGGYASVAGLTSFGHVGRGMLTIASGSRFFTASRMNIGYGGQAEVAITGDQSYLEAKKDLYIGNSAPGSLYASSNGAFYVGDHAATSAVSGFSYVSDTSANASDGGNLVITTSSQVNTALGLVVGNHAGDTGNVSISNSATLYNYGAGGVVLGGNGRGTLDLRSRGKLFAMDNISLGGFTGGQGIVTIDGAGSLLDTRKSLEMASGTLTTTNNGAFHIGDAASVNFIDDYSYIGDMDTDPNDGGGLGIVNGSVINSCHGLIVCDLPNTRAKIDISGEGSAFNNDGLAILGNQGLATMYIVFGGRFDNKADFYCGFNATGHGFVYLYSDGSALNARRDLVIGAVNGSGGVTTDAGGSVYVGDTAALSPGNRLLVISDQTANGSDGGNLIIGRASTLTHDGTTSIGPDANGGKFGRMTIGSATGTATFNAKGNVTVGKYGLLDIESNGRVNITSGGLTIATGGKVNVDQGSELKVTSDPASTITTIRDYIRTGYNGGTWIGAGITSIDALGRRVGYREAAGVITVRLTLAGDANLDSTVNFNDLVSLAQNYNLTGKVWAQGDFDYNGTVDFNDLVPLAQNYNQSLLLADLDTLGNAGGSDFAADWVLAQSLVPEPTSAAFLVSLLGLVGRRDRRPNLCTNAR
jgi:T5SS/PEP-CTERM-associated repeat protein